MGAALLILLREGLEISLVVAILLTYVQRSGRAELVRATRQGTLLACGACAVAAVVFYNVVGEFEGKSEQFIEGALALGAAVMLTWMIFWMRAHARSLSGELHRKLDGAAAHSTGAVTAVAFAAVAREGFEAVLFLLGAKTANSKGAEVVLGGAIGLAIAVVLGYLVYRGGQRFDLRRFFQVTGALLLLLAAGMLGKAAHEFREFFEVEGWLAVNMWNVTSGVFAKGFFADFLGGMFGWSPDEADRIRVLAYLAYLVPVAYLYLRSARPKAAAKAPSAAVLSGAELSGAELT